jgi:hypothetical protein
MTMAYDLFNMLLDPDSDSAAAPGEGEGDAALDSSFRLTAGACGPQPGGGSCGISSDCSKTHLWGSVVHPLKITSCSGMQLHLDRRDTL